MQITVFFNVAHMHGSGMISNRKKAASGRPYGKQTDVPVRRQCTSHGKIHVYFYYVTYLFKWPRDNFYLTVYIVIRYIRCMCLQSIRQTVVSRILFPLYDKSLLKVFVKQTLRNSIKGMAYVYAWLPCWPDNGNFIPAISFCLILYKFFVYHRVKQYIPSWICDGRNQLLWEKIGWNGICSLSELFGAALINKRKIYAEILLVENRRNTPCYFTVGPATHQYCYTSGCVIITDINIQ